MQRKDKIPAGAKLDAGRTKRAKNPQYTAENILHRQFHADKPNEKRLTDMTEFKWYEGLRYTSST